MSTDPVRYDPDALDRFLDDRPVVAGQPFVAGGWAPALVPFLNTVVAPPRPHTCTVCHGICEGS